MEQDVKFLLDEYRKKIQEIIEKIDFALYKLEI